MSGRTSMEQAKAIRAKRELAQELEDVKKFEAAIVGRGQRSSAKALPSKAQDEESQPSDDEDEEITVTKGKRKVCCALDIPLSPMASHCRQTLDSLSWLS